MVCKTYYYYVHLYILFYVKVQLRKKSGICAVYYTGKNLKKLYNFEKIYMIHSHY